MIRVGKQNFETNTVKVDVDGIEHVCDMFVDFEGDVSFILNGTQYCFHHIEYIDDMTWDLSYT